MQDSEDDPKFRQLLRKIAAVDVPDYPDWKRGWKWGLASGILTALVLFFFAFLGGGVARFWGSALGVAVFMFLTVGAIGAFRPRNDR